MIIQLVLICSLVLVALYLFGNRNQTLLRASKKLLFLGFIILACAAILDPNFLTKVANLFGVGRGADLLLYGLAVAFIFFVVSVYMKFKDYEYRIAKLARHIAIEEATNEKPPKN